MASGTRADLCVHILMPGIALLVWEGETGDGRARPPLVRVGGRPAAPHARISVALGSARRRNIMVLRADPAAVRQDEIWVAEAGGPVAVAVAYTVHDPAERPSAATPADLVASVDAEGRLRIARLMLEIVPGIFRLGDSSEFASACGQLAATLMPTPPALLPCSRLSNSYWLFTCTADAALGQNLKAVVVGAGRVRRAPFTSARVRDSTEESPGRLFLTLRDIKAGHPDALVVVFSERGMICRRIIASGRPVPSVGAWLRTSALARAGSPGPRYVLDCLAHIDRQEADAAALHREAQAVAPPSRGGSATAPVVAGTGAVVASGANSVQVIDIGCVSPMPDTAVIGPVPDDPLLMRCRAGQYAEDPGMRGVEVLYLLDTAQNQQEIAHFLRGLHAAYGTAARLVMVPRGGTSAAALNVGAQVSRAPVLVSLGRSILPESTAWLGALTGYLRRHADVGIVGARLLREDQALWNDGIDIGNGSEGQWDIRPIRAGRVAASRACGGRAA
jgi:hypothetical protein